MPTNFRWGSLSSPSEPHWASVNRGVLICDECCSVHRSLGRHSSQVRHLTHTPWPATQLQVQKPNKKMFFADIKVIAQHCWRIFFQNNCRSELHCPGANKKASCQFLSFHYQSRWFKHCTATAQIQSGSTLSWIRPL